LLWAENIALLEDIGYGIAECRRVLQHAEVTDVRENDELRSRDGPGQIPGVLRLDSLIVRAIHDGGSHRNPLQLRGREIRLLRPHGLDLREKGLVVLGGGGQLAVFSARTLYVTRPGCVALHDRQALTKDRVEHSDAVHGGVAALGGSRQGRGWRQALPRLASRASSGCRKRGPWPREEREARDTGREAAASGGDEADELIVAS